jgi:uncharacterized protein (TIGR03435 family)
MAVLSRVLPFLLCLAARGGAQSFEAAAVKVNQSGATAPNGFSPSPGELRVANCTLEQMIHAAFHVKSGALFGVSGWMSSERYDVNGKTALASTFDQELEMLRALLIDRFQLRFHSEIRRITTMALVVSKSGSRFQASKGEGAKERITIRAGEISGVNIPFGHFVSALGAQLSRPVANETGLSGNFDLSLKWFRDDANDGAGGPSLFTALVEQLGLKLESRKGSIEALVIDSAERPGGN